MYTKSPSSPHHCHTHSRVLCFSDPGWSGKEKGHLSCSGAAFYERNNGSSLPCSWEDHHCQKLPTWLWNRGDALMEMAAWETNQRFSAVSVHVIDCLWSHPAGDWAVQAIRFPTGTCRLWMPLFLSEPAPPPPGVRLSAPGAQGHFHSWQTQVCSSVLLA